jgi:hypothetical protein
MSKAREMAEIISTPPSIYATDAEVAATYLTQSSASTIYKGSNFRNLIINGAMQVAQRGTSFTGVTGAGTYAADRFLMNISSFATWTVTNENDAPTGSGFRKSAKYLVTTAEASPAGADYAAVLQKIEGQNLQQIRKGTSSAQPLMLSFWVKSNVTGTYSIMFYDNDNARFTSFTYTVSASATWEKKTILIPADTTGAFDNDIIDSLQVYFNLGSGSTYTGGSAQTSWSAGTAFGSQWMPSQTNVAASTNNYWQITGVQLEVGSVATDYEFKPFDIELRQCQRYYCKTFNYGTIPNDNQGGGGAIMGKGTGGSTDEPMANFRFPVAMRAAPTITLYNIGSGTAGQWSNGAGGGVSAAARASHATGDSGAAIDNSGTTLAGANQAYIHAVASIEL